MTGGEHVIVLDNRGSEYEVVLDRVGSGAVCANILEQHTAGGEPRVAVTLYQSLLKSDKFETVLQKCTEIGVSRFVPVITRRGLVRKAASVTEKKIARWNRIIIEAAEQSHRGRLPAIESCLFLPEAVADCGGLDRCVVASTQQNADELPAVLRRVDSAICSVGLFIGPEGGFDDEEAALLQDAGVHAIGLGPRILRTETAAMVTSALILYELGQMKR